MKKADCLPGLDVKFRLVARSLDFWVDVRLRCFGDRWIAVAELAGAQELGLGMNARQALTATLAPLGPRATRELLADPALMAVSCSVANFSRSQSTG